MTTKQELIQVLRGTRSVSQAHYWRGLSSDEVLDPLQFSELDLRASKIISYQSDIIPGLLQTESYAAGVFRSINPCISNEVLADRLKDKNERIKRFWDLQNRRQNSSGELCHVWIIVQESVLYREVGGKEVLHGQLSHLLKLLSENLTLNLQVLPINDGSSPGLAGSFMMYEIDTERGCSRVVCVERSPDVFYIRDTETSNVHRERWTHIVAAANSRTKSCEMIANRLRELETCSQ